MISNWSLIRLGQVLKRSEEAVLIRPDVEYREITVRLWGKGVVLRQVVSGASISSTRRFVARAGQFVLSRIDARNGAFGLVPADLDGAVVSNDFPVFAANQDLILPAFLAWFSRTAALVEMCQRASEGTTNRVRLQEDEFLALEVALPPIAEQRRLVARIEELAARIQDARDLRDEAAKSTQALAASCVNALFTSEAAKQWPRRSLEEVADVRSGVTLGRQLTGRTLSLPYLRVANVQDGHLDLSVIKHLEVLETEAKKWTLTSGDLLLTEGGDWDKLGRAAIWLGEIPNCIHQNHIFRVRIRGTDLLPEFVATLIGSAIGKTYFRAASKQTTKLASINQRQLMAFPVVQPPLSEQNRILTELSALKMQTEHLTRLQVQSAAELDALLPAILDRAFRGEL